MSELWRMSASDLALAIRAKTVSAREAVTAHLRRIEAVNPAVNAISAILADEALAAAAALDDRLARTGTVAGALHGVPLTVKENIDLAGSATTEGTRALASYVPAQDAPHIAQARAAGAIPIARTNLPDFGLRWHTDNALRGATRNPWDASRTPGGSSGGEAVALATGMTPLGMGNDLGGSLRVPSQFNGTAALKPSHGRIATCHTTSPVEPPITFQLWAVEGPMARHVRDLRRALEVICGGDPRDPLWVPAPLHGPGAVEPVRVAVLRDPGGLGVDAHVAAAVQDAALALADAGYRVEEAEPPVMDAYRSWLQLILCDIRLLSPVLGQLVSPDAARFVQTILELEPPSDLAAYAQGLASRLGIARAWARFQAERPLVLGPVCTEPPFPVGRDLEGVEAVRRLADSMRVTVAVNNLGLPSVAVPVGLAGGLPQGVQVIGPRYREDLCLAAAEAIEARRGVLTPIDPRATGVGAIGREGRT
jgi:amidase